MKVSLHEVINAHKNYAKFTCLKRNLGDGFLFHHNPVFRNVRQLFLALGYRFTDKDYCDYRTLSLAALPRILKARRVPYFDNYSPLEKIEKTSPRMFDTDTILMPTANYLMHESCHCISDAIFDNLSGTNGIVLRTIFCESVANAAESFGRIYVRDDIHRTFYNLNSDHPTFKRDPQVVEIERAVDAVGPRDSFKILFFSFLYANFLYKRVDKSDLRRVMGLLEIRPDKTLFPVFDIGVRNLNFMFRVKTSGFYFQHFHGFRHSIFALTNFNFMRHLEKTPRLLFQLNEIVERVLS